MSYKGTDKLKEFTKEVEQLESNIKKLLKLNKEKKVEKMKKKINRIHDIHEVNEVELSKKKFLKNIKEFFIANSNLRDDEIFYIVKANIDKEHIVQTYGAYYGPDSSPLSFLVNSKKSSDEVFLAEATSKEAMLEFIGKSTMHNRDENIYAFKVQYKDFKLCKLESIYGGKLNLSLFMFEYSDEEDAHEKIVLKRLGKIEYVPSLNYFMS